MLPADRCETNTCCQKTPPLRWAVWQELPRTGQWYETGDYSPSGATRARTLSLRSQRGFDLGELGFQFLDPAFQLGELPAGRVNAVIR